MLLMIDNYDSFTYNVVQYLGELGAEVHVVRNDEIAVEEIEALAPEKIVISPGPCTPNEAGISMAVIRAATRASCPCSVSASVTRASARCLAARWCARARSCTARPPPSTTGARASFTV